MTLCPADRGHCSCQPDEGVFCPRDKLIAGMQEYMQAEINAAQAELVGFKNMLQARVTDLRPDGKTIFDFFSTWLDQERAALSAAQAEIAALREDAERYRWLREHRQDSVGHSSLWLWLQSNDLLYGGLDAAIDAARQSSTQPKGS